jgi:hypothetical protein
MTDKRRVVYSTSVTKLFLIYKLQETIYLPGVVAVNYLARALFPVWLSDWLSDFLGVSATMDAFKGRGQQWSMGTDAGSEKKDK